MTAEDRSGRGGFDRIAPPADRAGERTGERARSALFTSAPDRGVTVRCSRCGTTSRLDVVTALRSAVPLVLVAPWRDHPVFAICPACRRRSWLRPGVRT